MTMHHERSTCLMVPATVTVSLLTGALAGWFFTKPADVAASLGGSGGGGTLLRPNLLITRKMMADAGSRDREMMQRLMDAKGIEQKLRYMSSKPRVAGTEGSRDLAEWFKHEWEEMGMDSIGIEEYDVLLSYPLNMSHYNKVEILHADGRIKYVSPRFEKPVAHEQFNDPGMPPYSAYSKSGIVEGDVVYVNHCTAEDLMFVEQAFSMNISGKIALARYGGLIPAYHKMQVASEHGAKALLLFSHPFEEAPNGADNVFPDSQWLPETGVRRGAILTRLGDPLTQGYPANEFAPRLSDEEAADLYMASIPVQPIDYNTARNLFKAMDPETPQAPNTGAWTIYNPEERFGKSIEQMKQDYNFYPRIGGRMRDDQSVRITVNNTLERRKIYNTHAVIQGATEPDRFVIVGSHRDAWVYGAADPGGGGAVMLELSAAMAQMMLHGWRPRRTIIFSSWDAEEFGVIGSTEWVEDKLKILTHKAVAYINIDVAVVGTSLLEASASPLLHNLIFQAAAQVDHPHFPSLLEAWKNQSIMHANQMPRIHPLQPNSDLAPFFFTAGIPASNIYYSSAHRHGYPAYHTGYDTFHYVSKFVDPSFSHHLCLAHLYGEMTRRLSDDAVIPLDARGYAGVLHDAVKWIRVSLYFSDKLTWLKGHGAHLIKRLEESVSNFSSAAEMFHAELQFTDLTQPYKLRAINDRLMLVERSFIDVDWAQGSYYKHILLSPERFGGKHIFGIGPGINEVLSDPQIEVYLRSSEDSMPPHHYRRIQQQFAKLCFAINTAAEVLLV